MKWRRVDRYHIRDDTEQYSISRASCGDFVVYTAWHGRTTGGRVAQLLGQTRFRSGDEHEALRALAAAKQLCIDHNERSET